MSDQIAIKVQGVSKAFKLPHEKNSSVKSLFLNLFTSNRTYEKQQVLQDISFDIKKGEFFGIVGRNGSGKSTLLKMLAGIYTPDSGSISIDGKIMPFIELGVGFNMELTGRENVYLNGALLGFSRKAIDQIYDEIVDFAELEKFMDQKLKNYSSGMQVRLAFSIAIRAKSPILLLDEVLAVGDEAFQKKCIDIFELYKAEKQTIVLVTHDMQTVRRFCNKAILIDKGKIIEHGEPNHIAAKYSRLNRASSPTQAAKTKPSTIKTKFTNSENKKSAHYTVGETLSIKVDWPKDIGAVENVGLAVIKNSGEFIFGTNTIDSPTKIRNSAINYDIKLSLEPGKYYVMVGLFGKTKNDVIEFLDRGDEFIIEDEPHDKYQGVVRLEHKWSITDDEK